MQLKGRSSGRPRRGASGITAAGQTTICQFVLDDGTAGHGRFGPCHPDLIRPRFARPPSPKGKARSPVRPKAFPFGEGAPRWQAQRACRSRRSRDCRGKIEDFDAAPQGADEVLTTGLHCRMKLPGKPRFAGTTQTANARTALRFRMDDRIVAQTTVYAAICILRQPPVYVGFIVPANRRLSGCTPVSPIPGRISGPPSPQPTGNTPRWPPGRTRPFPRRPPRRCSG